MGNAGRPREPVDADAPAVVQDFAAALGALATAAGNPRRAVIARRAGVAEGTVSQIFQAKRFPTKEVAGALVRALGGDEAEWSERWRRTKSAMAADRQQARTAGGAGSRGSLRAGIWSVPAVPSPRFLGRDDELQEIRRRLVGAGPPLVLNGMGGVGKTQLALAYIHRHRSDYDLVWWVPAEEPVTATDALAQLAEELGFGATGNADRAARAAVSFLARASPPARCLLVLDNLPAPGDVHALLATGALAKGVHVLVTSRRHDWSHLAATLSVHGLPPAAAARLLRARASMLSTAQSERLAEALGYLPLALDHAGAFLQASRMPAGQYLDLLDRRMTDVLRRGAPEGHASVTATLAVAVGAFQNPAAHLLLQLLAQFGPAPVSLSWIHPGIAASLPAPLDTVVADPIVFGELVAHLTAASFLSSDDETEQISGEPAVPATVTLHRLVRAFLRESTPAPAVEVLRSGVQEIIADAVARAGPVSEVGTVAPLSHHLLATDAVEGSTKAGRALTLWFVWALRAVGDLPNSLGLGDRAYQEWRARLGDDHLDTVLAAMNLSATLWAQGEHDRVRALEGACRIRDAQGTVAGDSLLALLRNEFGDDHRHVITAKANIAATRWLDALEDPAAYEEARALFADVLDQAGRILGDEHPHTLRAAAYLGATLLGQGNLAEATPLLRAVHARARVALGERHPDTELVYRLLVDGGIRVEDEG